MHSIYAYEIGISQLLRLSVRLWVNSRWLVAKFWGCPKLQVGFWSHWDQCPSSLHDSGSTVHRNHCTHILLSSFCKKVGKLRWIILSVRAHSQEMTYNTSNYRSCELHHARTRYRVSRARSTVQRTQDTGPQYTWVRILTESASRDAQCKGIGHSEGFTGHGTQSSVQHRLQST